MKYYKMSGEFAQDGEKWADYYCFNGFIELEDEVYSYEDQNVGTVDVQHFKGIQIDAYDKARKPRLVLGALQSGENIGQTMYFKKLVRDSNVAPISYGLEMGGDGTYRGHWMPEMTMFQEQEEAELTSFEELTAGQVKELGVEEFLADGYSKNKNLPPEMRMVVEQYNMTKKLIMGQKLKTQRPEYEQQKTKEEITDDIPF